MFRVVFYWWSMDSGADDVAECRERFAVLYCGIPGNLWPIYIIRKSQAPDHSRTTRPLAVSHSHTPPAGIRHVRLEPARRTMPDYNYS
ncbi:hypothetical protein VTK56DRAFT_6617 [Thermocarpiscus australiensis]